MSDSMIYDLGEIDRPTSIVGEAPRPAPAAVPRIPRPTPSRSPRPVAAPRYAHPARGVPARLCATFDLVLPGSGQLLGGRPTTAVLQLLSLALAAAVGWALWVTLERVAHTATVLGASRGVGLWILGGLYGALAVGHVSTVLATPRPDPDRDRGVPSWVAAFASLLLPGWGQLLAGHRRRAALLVAGLWIAGFSWLLVSPWLDVCLVRLDLHLPAELLAVGSPVLRWTLPAVIWSLAVYDAALCASRE